jgi:endonuclease/exonuclease/phosphatase family metal-dependent hydrolase
MVKQGTISDRRMISPLLSYSPPIDDHKPSAAAQGRVILATALLLSRLLLFSSAEAAAHGEEGSAILSRFPITASRVHELPRCRKWLEPRIMLQTAIETTWGPLQVFSAHTGRGDECQMERVGKIVRDHAGPGPSLLMGDFNTPETSQILSTLNHLDI